MAAIVKTDELVVSQISQGIRPEDLTGWKKAAYKITLFAPKFILSGIGGTFGSYLPVIGTVIGYGVGSYAGCMLSLGVEILIRKYILHDPTLQAVLDNNSLLKERSKEALVVAASSMIAVGVFSAVSAYVIPAIMNTPFFHGLVTRLISAGIFLVGAVGVRCAYHVSMLTYHTHASKLENKVSPLFVKSDDGSDSHQDIDSLLSLSEESIASSTDGLVVDCPAGASIELPSTVDAKNASLDKRIQATWRQNLKEDIRTTVKLALPVLLPYSIFSIFA